MVRRLPLLFSLMLSLVFPALAVAPKVFDFTPKKGPPGTVVTVFGQNFQGSSSQVTFFNGGSGAQAQIVNGGNGLTTLNVLVPLEAKTGPISVFNPGVGGGTGTSPNNVGFFQPAPRITDFYTKFDVNTSKPVTPVKRADGEVLTIRGANFSDPPNGASVYVGGVKVPLFSNAADNQIAVSLLSGLQTGQLVVTTSAGTVTNDSTFSGGLVYFNPVVERFTGSAAAGATIDIFGRSFLGVTEVRFGNLASEFTVVSGTNIQAKVPATAVDGPLRVTSPGGAAITVSNFLVGPSITSFSPAGGPPGTVVTVKGTGLSNTKTILFGSVATQKGTNIDANTVTAVVPLNTFTAPLTVITGNGTNVSATPFYLPPRVDGFTPTSGLVGTLVTLTGVNFTGATKVELGGQSLDGFNVTATNKLTVTVPDGAVSGKFRVTGPGGVDETTDTFAVVGPLPTISGFTPTAGPVGTQVTISGANLTTATKVEFNGQSAITVSVSGANLIATVPAGATTGPIRVTNPAGQVTSGGSFTVAGNADLLVTLTPSLNPAIAYGVLGYSLHLENRGPLAAASTKLEFTIPTGATFDSVVGDQNFELLGSKVTFDRGSFANSGRFDVKVLVRLGAPSSLKATLVASSTTTDTLPANNTASSTVSSALPALSLDPLDAGSIFLQWPSPATNFVLESTAALATPTTWSPVTKVPDDDGVTRQLVLPATDPAAYFRLRLNQ